MRCDANCVKPQIPDPIHLKVYLPDKESKIELVHPLHIR